MTAFNGTFGKFARAIEAAILAKLNSAEPVGEIRHNPGGCYEGSHIPAAPYDFPEFYGPLPPIGTKLYTPPQPDRTAELEAALREALEAMKDFDYEKRILAIATIDKVLKP